MLEIYITRMPLHRFAPEVLDDSFQRGTYLSSIGPIQWYLRGKEVDVTMLVLVPPTINEGERYGFRTKTEKGVFKLMAERAVQKLVRLVVWGKEIWV